MPSAGRMALNFTKAMVKAVRKAPGGIGASEEVIASRRTECESNRCGFYVSETERCAHKQCGCFLRAKTWLKSQTCPDGRW